MSKLWVFGCSHTTPSGVSHDEWWATILAKKLGIRLPKQIRVADRGFSVPVEGDGGCGIGIIFLNVMTKVHLGLIKPDDVVIFNASYSTRIQSSELVSKPTKDKRWVNWHMSIMEHFKANYGKDYKREDLIDMNYKSDQVLFAHWYLKQSHAYKLLKSTGAEVYQWLLEPKDLLEDVLNSLDENHLREESKKKNIEQSETIYYLLKDRHNGWENLLECPKLTPPIYTRLPNLGRFSDGKAIDCWSDVFAEVFPIEYRKDGHMNIEGNQFFANSLYNSILKIKNENK